MLTDKIPDWRIPKSEHEAISLVLDIIIFLETTQENSSVRDQAFRKAFELASSCPINWTPNESGITKIQRTAIMNVLASYGSEVIVSIINATIDCPTAETVDLLAFYISNYNAPGKLKGAQLLQSIKDDYSEKVRQIKEDYCISNSRSTIIWQDHQLVYFYKANVWSPIYPKSSEDPIIYIKVYPLLGGWRAECMVCGVYGTSDKHYKDENYYSEIGQALLNLAEKPNTYFGKSKLCNHQVCRADKQVIANIKYNHLSQIKEPYVKRERVKDFKIVIDNMFVLNVVRNND